MQLTKHKNIGIRTLINMIETVYIVFETRQGTNLIGNMVWKINMITVLMVAKKV